MTDPSQSKQSDAFYKARRAIIERGVRETDKEIVAFINTLEGHLNEVDNRHSAQVNQLNAEVRALEKVEKKLRETIEFRNKNIEKLEYEVLRAMRASEKTNALESARREIKAKSIAYYEELGREATVHHVDWISLERQRLCKKHKGLPATELSWIEANKRDQRSLQVVFNLLKWARKYRVYGEEHLANERYYEEIEDFEDIYRNSEGKEKPRTDGRIDYLEVCGCEYGITFREYFWNLLKAGRRAFAESMAWECTECMYSHCAKVPAPAISLGNRLLGTDQSVWEGDPAIERLILDAVEAAGVLRGKGVDVLTQNYEVSADNSDVDD